MDKLLLSLFTGTLLGFSTGVFPRASVEIVWQDPQKFSDVKASNDSEIRFRAQVFSQLEEFINKLAEKLPDGQTLKMTVTDLDLAGQVWPASFIGFGPAAGDIRLIKSIDIPRIRFAYQLLDSEGTLIKSAEVDLKDMSFQERANPYFEGEPLRYERNMLKRWFSSEFPDIK